MTDLVTGGRLTSTVGFVRSLSPKPLTVVEGRIKQLGISDNGLKVLAVGTIVGVRWQRVARLPTRAAPGQRFALD